jgi:CheY-like chemotaxis protein
MGIEHTVLLVDSDLQCGHALAAVLRRAGGSVRVVRTRAQARQAVRRAHFDVAIVDLFVEGGGPELARELARRVPRVLLSLGADLEHNQLLEAALGFPVCRKAMIEKRLRDSDASSSDATSEAKCPGFSRRRPGASATSPELVALARGRVRRP